MKGGEGREDRLRLNSEKWRMEILDFGFGIEDMKGGIENGEWRTKGEEDRG
jgi:anti-sigma regulatory factor (Ser/Thr protein kinase)